MGDYGASNGSDLLGRMASHLTFLRRQLSQAELTRSRTMVFIRLLCDIRLWDDDDDENVNKVSCITDLGEVAYLEGY